MTILINKKITHEFVTELMNQIQRDNETGLRVVFFNCPGGDVAAGLALMDYCRWKYQTISTMAFGVVASLGAMMFSCWPVAGEKTGRRCMAPNAMLMFHPIESVTHEDEEYTRLIGQRYDAEFGRKGLHAFALKALREENVFVTPTEAVQHHIADYIL